jgi:hypothetical protein
MVPQTSEKVYVASYTARKKAKREKIIAITVE